MKEPDCDMTVRKTLASLAAGLENIAVVIVTGAIRPGHHLAQSCPCGCNAVTVYVADENEVEARHLWPKASFRDINNRRGCTDERPAPITH